MFAPPWWSRLEIEPARTFRGHTGAVLCIAMLPVKASVVVRSDAKGGLCLTGGADAAIHLWRVPSSTDPQTPYAVGGTWLLECSHACCRIHIAHTRLPIAPSAPQPLIVSPWAPLWATLMLYGTLQ